MCPGHQPKQPSGKDGCSAASRHQKAWVIKVSGQKPEGRSGSFDQGSKQLHDQADLQSPDCKPKTHSLNSAYEITNKTESKTCSIEHYRTQIYPNHSLCMIFCWLSLRFRTLCSQRALSPIALELQYLSSWSNILKTGLGKQGSPRLGWGKPLPLAQSSLNSLQKWQGYVVAQGQNHIEISGSAAGTCRTEPLKVAHQTLTSNECFQFAGSDFMWFLSAAALFGPGTMVMTRASHPLGEAPIGLS